MYCTILSVSLEKTYLFTILLQIHIDQIGLAVFKIAIN